MRLCVFLGSRIGLRPNYDSDARQLGRYLASSGIGLVYGGASIGLMGELARSCSDAGGEVIGVIPHRITKIEIPAEKITKLIYVETLAEREELMFSYSDGFIALPGGLGTLEELFTVLTWNALDYHDKPVGLLNSGGYYDQLLKFFEFQTGQGFVPPRWVESIIVENDVPSLVDRMVQSCTKNA